MQINNFKRLMEEEERIYAERYEQKIRSSLANSLGAFRFIGEVVDMYLPKIFDLLVVALGGNIKQSGHTPTNITTTPPSQAAKHTNGKKSPGQAQKDDNLR